MGLKNLYLIAYNAGCVGGWAYVWLKAVQALSNNATPAALWADVGKPLTAVQFVALLEIVHSAIGVVRSPLLSAFIQVMSRVTVLGMYTMQSTTAQAHWSLYLMVLSWASVEVPRYLFYAVNLLPMKMPSFLFFLRYSLFMILYPTGISGEIMQIVKSLPFWAETMPVIQRMSHLLLSSYVPLGPFMIFTMYMMRKRAYRNLQKKSAAPRPVDGVVWPVTKPETGDRASTPTNKEIWAAAIGAVDAEGAEKIKKERNWRFGYPKYIEHQVRKSAETPEAALAVAKTGLKKAHDLFQFARDGKETSLREAMDTITGSFETGFIQGEAKKPASGFSLEVPYKDEMLSGDKLVNQLDSWVANDTIEPSAADAIKACIKHPEWLDLSDRYFVLLGATSAMGPLDTLLAFGANIIAIDLDRPFIWEKLITKARNSCGTLTFPMNKPQSDVSSDEELFQVSGSNLLGKTPEIANWLCTVCPGKPLTIGNYTYLDGALHVQLSIASDVIMEKVCAARGDTSLAFLCTPTDTHLIPKAAHDAAAANLKKAQGWLKLVAGITPKTMLQPNALKPVAKSGLYLVDGITAPQGPNYALAKRMQHWRSMVARSNGHIVSTNIAPSTATKSVVSNPQFAAAYAGFYLFDALEVMYQETSAAVMNAILQYDLNCPTSAANPTTELENPLMLFAHGGFHGGAWRCPYKIGTIGEVAAGSFYLKKYWLPLLTTLGMFGSAANYVATGNMVPLDDLVALVNEGQDKKEL